LKLSFEFKVWQDAKQSTAGGRLDRKRLQREPVKTSKLAESK